MNASKVSTLVMKFGGTSAGSAAALKQVVKIVRQAREAWSRVAVVVSAMSGVTNLLLDTATEAASGNVVVIDQVVETLRLRHQEAYRGLLPAGEAQVRLVDELEDLIQDFAQLCRAIAVLGEATPRALDAVAAHGERMNVRQVSALLNAAGIQAEYIDASELIVTDDCYQAAHPDLVATREKSRTRLSASWEQGRVPVVTGFIGANEAGITTTLGRGGSDYTAAILGAVLPANEVWIWTDVTGVMSADPRLVPEAHTIPEMSYREIAELAYYGAKVLHPKAIRPVIEAGIGLRVCNTFMPSEAGTNLVADRPLNGPGGAIKAVTAVRNLGLVTIEGRGMLGVPGVAARTFGAVAATGTSVPLITQASSEQSICFAVPLSAVDRVASAIETAFAAEIARRDIDRIIVSDPVTIITVVGAGMQHTPGIAGKLFGALGAADVNVIAIAQGSSDAAISLVVSAAQAETGVRAIHALIQAENNLRGS